MTIQEKITNNFFSKNEINLFEENGYTNKEVESIERILIKEKYTLSNELKFKLNYKNIKINICLDEIMNNEISVKWTREFDELYFDENYFIIERNI